MSELSEQRRIEKLRALEALYARPGTTAEGQAAANVRERILERLAEVSTDDEPVEYRFSMPDMWSRRVFAPCSAATAFGPTATGGNATPP